MLCPKCGSEISENAKFCTKCGNKIEQPVVAAPQQPNLSSHNISTIWPEWQIEGKPLGKGSFGVVYKAVRRDHNVESYAAIKVISIPADPSEVDSLRSEGLDMNATRTYLQGIVNDFVSEIQLMESLKGVQNIVSVEDYKVVEKTGEIGWDIYIRMELLTPFNTHICDKKLTEEEVIKLGCDICTALEICGKRNIIHRDIKPENIFINDFGYFKLGDFGIARKMENMTGGLSQKGTFNYMAPEVATSSEYDARVDTYSLGIVLYRLLNGNRLPFLDTEKQLLNPNERRNAVDRRIRGEELPAPCDASPAMADLILRACAFDPNARFASATEMKQALMSVASGTYQVAAVSGLDKTTSVRKAPADYDKTTSVRKASVASDQKSAPAVNTFGSTPKKKSKLPAIIAAVLAVVILIGVGIFAIPKFLGDNDSSGSGNSTDSSTVKEKDYSKTEEKEITAIISEAEALANEEDYEGALAKVNAGLKTFPKSENLKKKSEEYNSALKAKVKAETLEEAEKLAESGDFAAAMALIKNAQNTYGDDADYQNAYETYEQTHKAIVKTDALEKANGFAEQKDHLNAYKTIKQALTTVGEDAELTAKATEYEEAYVSSVLISVDKMIESGDIYGAEALITSAQAVFLNNSELAAKSTEVEGLKPVSLAKQTLIDSEGWSVNEGDPTDIFGNAHYSSYTSLIYNGNSMFGDSGYAEYRIYKQFTTLTGTISPYKLIEGATVRIIADDVVARTFEVGKKTDPIAFSIDVTGVDYIKFEVSLLWSSGVIISDVELSNFASDNSATPVTPKPPVGSNSTSGPTSLSKQTLIDSEGWSVNEGDPTDIFGNAHYSSYTSLIYNGNSMFGDSGYAEYRIYKQFTTLTGTISPYKLIEGATVRIIADDVVARTFEVGKKTDPIAFSIDVTGVDYIKFEVSLLWSSGVIISDVELD